jgi:hypothetical protein
VLPKAFYGLSAYQWLAAMLILAGMLSYSAPFPSRHGGIHGTRSPDHNSEHADDDENGQTTRAYPYRQEVILGLIACLAVALQPPTSACWVARTVSWSNQAYLHRDICRDPVLRLVLNLYLNGEEYPHQIDDYFPTWAVTDADLLAAMQKSHMQDRAYVLCTVKQFSSWTNLWSSYRCADV